jgi:hypothetical protein
MESQTINLSGEKDARHSKNEHPRILKQTLKKNKNSDDKKQKE